MAQESSSIEKGLRFLVQKALWVFWLTMAWLGVCIFLLLAYPTPADERDVLYLPILLFNVIAISLVVVTFFALAGIILYGIKKRKLGNTLWLFIFMMVGIFAYLSLLGAPLQNGPIHVSSYFEEGNVYHIARTPFWYDGGQQITYKCGLLGMLCEVTEREPDLDTDTF